MAPELSPLNERFIVEALAERLFSSREELLDRAIDALRLAMDFDVPPAAGETTAGEQHVFSARVNNVGVEQAGVEHAVADHLNAERILGGPDVWDSDAWDSDAVMRRIFERLAESGVRTND